MSDDSAMRSAPLVADPESVADVHCSAVAGRALGDCFGLDAVVAARAVADCSGLAVAVAGHALAGCAGLAAVVAARAVAVARAAAGRAATAVEHAAVAAGLVRAYSAAVQDDFAFRPSVHAVHKQEQQFRTAETEQLY